jgi:PAS domain S-box-containing protein
MPQNNHFIKIFNAMPLPSLLLAADAPHFTIKEANTAYLNITGTNISHLLGKGIFEAFPVNPDKPFAEGAKKLRNSLLESITTKQPHKMAVQHFDIPVRGSGCFEERYAEIENTPVLDNEGRVDIIIHSVTDVTGKIRAEEKRKESDSNLAEAQKMAKMGNWDLDCETGKITWSNELHNVFGTDKKTFAESLSSFLSLIDTEDKDFILENCRHTRETGDRFTVEYHITTPQGEKRTIWENGYGQIDANGKVIRLFGIAQDITERKKSEEKIKESELRYRSLIEQATDAICIAAPNHAFIDVNPTACRLFGYSKEEFLHLSLHHLLLADELKTNHLKVDEVTSGKTVRNERTLRKKDGTTILMEVSTKMLADGNVVIFGRDISEQKKAEENNRFKALLLNTVGQGVIATELDGVITYWNRAAELVYGWTAGEAIGKNILHLIPAQQTKEQANEILRQLYQGRSWSGELTIQRKDGQYLTIFTTNSPVYGPNNTVSGLMGVSFDITERKKANEEMKYLANKLLLATSSAGIGIWDWDIEKGYLGWDENMYRLYNINELQFDPVYQSWISRLHPEDKDRVNKDLQLAITGEKEYNTEFRIIWDNSSVHYIKAAGMVKRSGSGNAIRMIGVNWDVTESRLFENRLHELNKNLQKHSKELAISNAELEQFAYVASHDLQEPLRMITSFLTQLEQKYGPVMDGRGRKYIEFAVDGAKRMRQIILDLLEFSRVGKAGDDVEDLDLDELLAEIKILLRKKTEEKNAVITVGKLPVIHAHRSPTRQVFQNIIDNALKYSKEGVAPHIIVSAKDKKSQWEFSVKDNGIGIEKEYFEKIFIIFQRLHNKDEYSGTGMGLAITKKIVENQGGKIWVESEEGKGSTFYFTLLKQ